MCTFLRFLQHNQRSLCYRVSSKRNALLFAYFNVQEEETFYSLFDCAATRFAQAKIGDPQKIQVS
jgi:hypothetical protein